MMQLGFDYRWGQGVTHGGGRALEPPGVTLKSPRAPPPPVCSRMRLLSPGRDDSPLTACPLIAWSLGPARQEQGLRGGALLLPVAMGSSMEVLPWRLWAEGNSTGWARALVGKWVVGGAEFSVWHPLSPVLSVKGTRTKPRACSWDLRCGHRPLCPGQLGEPGGSIGWAGGQAWAWKLLLCLGLRAQEVPSSSPALPWTGSHLGSAPPLDVGVHTKSSHTGHANKDMSRSSAKSWGNVCEPPATQGGP